jgi:transcriptional regulator with XRE-family HTH domain
MNTIDTEEKSVEDLTPTERLKILQQELGFVEQVDMASALNIQPAMLSDIYRGRKYYGVSKSIKKVLEEKFDVNLEWLETGTGEMFKPTAKPRPATPKPGSEEFSNKIYAARFAFFRKKHIHKTQIEASEMLGISQAGLSNIESGKAPVTFELLTKLIKDFKLNQEWFTDGHGKPIEKNPPKSTLLTDLNALNLELESLKKHLKFMEANQMYILNLIERLEKKVDSKK